MHSPNWRPRQKFNAACAGKVLPFKIYSNVKAATLLFATKTGNNSRTISNVVPTVNLKMAIMHIKTYNSNAQYANSYFPQKKLKYIFQNANKKIEKM